MEDKTKEQNIVMENIYAITNLDAEDLGSSILKTYTTADEAYSELEKIEAGTHQDFFAGGVLEVFEIQLPSDYANQQTALLKEENERLKDTWISVSNRLPELIDDENYSHNVFAIEDGEIRIMCYCYIPGDDGGFIWADCDYKINGDAEFDDNYEVTHWMHLPKSPKV